MASATKSLRNDAGHDGTEHDERIMDILSRLDQLKGMAAAAGEHDLVMRLNEAFEACLNRYCDAKRADLSDTMRHHFKPPREYLN